MKNTSDQLYKQVRAEVFGSIAKFQGGGKPSTRGAAFQAARDAGEREFTYNNNSFHTRKEGESKQDWEKFLGGRRPDAQPAEQPVVQNLAGTVDGVVPQNQTAFRQDTRSNFAIKAANMKDNLLYKMGWKSDGDAEGKGRTRKLAENVVIPAVAGTALAGAPLVAGAIGAVNLPGSISQAHAS